MTIGLICDTKEDHHLRDDSGYFDFSFKDEIEYVKSKLQLLGYAVEVIHDLKTLLVKIKTRKIDLVFNMYEGLKSRNREAFVPTICEFYKIPYTGSDAFAMSLSLNKYHLKRFAAGLGVHTAKDKRVLSEEEICGAIKDWGKYPCVVKPEHEGSSMGVSLADTPEQLSRFTKEIFRIYHEAAIWEEYLPGKEYSVCLLEKQQEAMVYTVKEFSGLKGETMKIFGEDAKQLDNHLSKTCNIYQPLVSYMCQQSLRIFHEIPLRDFARIDWRIGGDGQEYLLEVTPLPDWRENTEFEFGSERLERAFEIILENVKSRYRL